VAPRITDGSHKLVITDRFHTSDCIKKEQDRENSDKLHIPPLKQGKPRSGFDSLPGELQNEILYLTWAPLPNVVQERRVLRNWASALREDFSERSDDVNFVTRKWLDGLE
jgi:hypothetical protein